MAQQPLESEPWALSIVQPLFKFGLEVCHIEQLDGRFRDSRKSPTGALQLTDRCQLPRGVSSRLPNDWWPGPLHTGDPLDSVAPVRLPVAGEATQGSASGWSQVFCSEPLPICWARLPLALSQATKCLPGFLLRERPTPHFLSEIS